VTEPLPTIAGGPEPSVLARMINIRVGCRM
jgi:hypothetical protein